MRELVDSAGLVAAAGALQARLQSNSYLFFRSLLPANAVLDVRRDVIRTLEAHGWLVGDKQDAALPVPPSRLLAPRQ